MNAICLWFALPNVSNDFTVIGEDFNTTSVVNVRPKEEIIAKYAAWLQFLTIMVGDNF